MRDASGKARPRTIRKPGNLLRRAERDRRLPRAALATFGAAALGAAAFGAGCDSATPPRGDGTGETNEAPAHADHTGQTRQAATSCVTLSRGVLGGVNDTQVASNIDI